MKHDFDKFFETDSIYWQKVLAIIEKNKDYPKKIVKGRNLHHVFPKSFSKKMKEPIDNDEDNLISLSLSEHFLIHYYYYKCARKGYRVSMSLAYRLMARKAIKYCSDETVEAIATDWMKFSEAH